MSRNYLSEFSREEIKIGEEDEEIVSLNKRTPTEETISYQRTLLKRANEEIEGLKQDREQRMFSWFILRRYSAIFRRYFRILRRYSAIFRSNFRVNEFRNSYRLTSGRANSLPPTPNQPNEYQNKK